MEKKIEVESAAAVTPGFRLRNPFVLKIGQMMTGFGAGCGIGIGFPSTMYTGALTNLVGDSQPMREMRRMIGRSGSQAQLQRIIKGLGVKNLEAGVGCGVGIGYGFALVGISLKPGIVEEIWQFVQGRVISLSKRFNLNLGMEGNPTGQINALSGINSLIPSSSGRNLNSMKNVMPQIDSAYSSLPKASNSVNEIERLKLDKEILQTLLRQQRRMEEIEEEFEQLRHSLNSNSNSNSNSSSDSSSNKKNEKMCFECRRRR